jgi:uncharacterized membrane protein
LEIMATTSPAGTLRAAGNQTQRVVASFTSYADAERAVDHLADHGFPVERVAIIGRDPQLVERVTGRRGYGQAALNGATAGSLFGALFGWLFGLFNWIHPLINGLLLAAYGLVSGAGFGALAGLLSHWALGGRRNFSSVGGMVAARYDVVVDDEMAAEAEQRLAELGDSAVSTAP